MVMDYYTTRMSNGHHMRQSQLILHVYAVVLWAIYTYFILTYTENPFG